MENCTAITGDEVREEESSSRISGSLPRRVPSCLIGMPAAGCIAQDSPIGGAMCFPDIRVEACKQESNAKPLCHMVFKYLNLSLLAIVGVEYEAISKDPTKTLALYTWSFVIAILVYSLILFAMKQPRNRSNKNLQIILGRVLFASGVVSSLSLLSVLLPHLYGLIVLYISGALFVVISAAPQLQGAYNGLLARITTVIDFAKKLLSGSNSYQQPSPPQETTPEQPTPQETIPPV